MRFLVTADIHLTDDHPERQQALASIVRHCEDENADYLLIAGDLFDANVDVEAIKTDLRDLFSGNSFQTLAIPGNHDQGAYREEDHFGADIEILKERPFEQRDLGEVNLVAVPFVEEGFGTLVDDLNAARDPAKLNVLLLHGTLSTSTGKVFGEESRYLPFTPEQLLETGFEYGFAGHIHSSPTKQTFGEDACVFAYPGSPVSITRKETDRRGLWCFDTDGMELQEQPLDTFHYVRERLDLSPGEAPDAIERLERTLADQNLEHATLLIEPAGFIEMPEDEFFERLTDVAEAAGTEAYDIDRSEVQSAKTILESSLYQQFEAKLEEKDDIDRRAVRQVALQGLSAEERS